LGRLNGFTKTVSAIVNGQGDILDGRRPSAGVKAETTTLPGAALDAGAEEATYRRNFAFLHPDTRERGNWEDGRGPIFGGWFWGGGHETPPQGKELIAMAAAGAETSIANYSQAKPEIRAIAEKYHFISEAAFAAHGMYVSGFCAPIGGAPKFDPAKPEESGAAVVEVLSKVRTSPGR